MNLQTILFDLDDTLVHCNKYFELVVDQFTDQMETWFSGYGIKSPDIRAKQAELDVAAVQSYGFTIEHFPQSFSEAYLFFSDMEGRPTSKAEIDFLIKLGKSVYDMDTEPYPHMRETLMALNNRGHEMCLYTGGVEQIQRRKIERLGLQDFFGDRVFIALHKDQQALLSVLEQGSFDRERTWMIGNSLRTDIMPAIENHIHSIHIPALHEWDYNNIDIPTPSRGRFLRLPSLVEVPQAIDRYAS